jgi:hypothetical protein
MVMARMATLPKGVNQHTANAASIPTQAEAAKMLNVSIESGQRARVVFEKGTPELVAVVEQGHLAVSVAARV